MRGEKVIARSFGGVPVVLRVWEAGKEALEPIGFPVADVFAYDEAFPPSGETGAS